MPEGIVVTKGGRNGRDWSKEFLAVAEALRALKADEIVLDGEAMAHCKDGLPNFRLHRAPPQRYLFSRAAPRPTGPLRATLGRRFRWERSIQFAGMFAHGGAPSESELARKSPAPLHERG